MQLLNNITKLKVFNLFLSSARIPWLVLFCVILSLISVGYLCTCDAKDDADSMTWYWLAMGIRFEVNFDLVPNICHKRKGDGIDSKGESGWWPKQVMIVGVNSRRGGEDNVNSKAGEGRGRMIVNFDERFYFSLAWISASTGVHLCILISELLTTYWECF